MAKSPAFYCPRLLRTDDAASYVGLGRTKFLELVDEGRIARPKRQDQIVTWDVKDLDDYLLVEGDRRPTVSIYFLQAGDDGPVKIGLSGNLNIRLSALQTASPYELILRVAVEGTEDLERSYHERFASSRIRGEWFEPTEELLKLIEELRQ